VDTTIASPDHAALAESYRKLLSELVGNARSTGVRRTEWPDSLLPAPPSEISDALGRVLIDHPDQASLDRHEAMTALLQRFNPDQGVISDFISSLVTTPFMIGLAYSIWLGVRGEGWLWLVSAMLFGVSWRALLLTHFARAHRLAEGSWARGFILGIVRSLAGLICLGSTSALWIRLVFGGAVGGIYQSLFVRFDLIGLVLALIALWIGWYFSKTLGALYYFERAPLRTERNA
jgi:hypothetical protein